MVLNKENWCMITYKWKNKKGAGIAVIHHKGLECELQKESELRLISNIYCEVCR